MTTEHQDVEINNVPEEGKGGKNKNKIKQCEEWLNYKYDFRMNVITSKPQYSEKDAEVWENIDDDLLASLWRGIQHDGYNFSESYIFSVLKSDFSPRVDPIGEYFSGLEYCDKEDYLAHFADTIAVSNYSKERWRYFFKKWIVGMVANYYVKNDCMNHLCLVLGGEQGVGKSTWFKNVLPKELSPYFYAGKIDPENKDHLFLTASHLLVNVDDYFDSVGFKKSESLKGFITEPVIKGRRPYGRTEVTLAKISSFGATSNSDSFLHDSTGSRRFLSAQVTFIFNELSLKLDRSKIFAQAIHLFHESKKGNYRYWLDEKDKNEMEKANELFQVDTHEFELAAKYIRHPESSETEKIEILTNADLIVRLGAYTKQKLSTRILGKELKRMGFKKKSITGGAKGYKLVWLGEEGFDTKPYSPRKPEQSTMPLTEPVTISSDEKS